MSTPDATPQADNEDRRLWTPWRMAYVGGGAKEPGCVFCNRLRADQDVASLILDRAQNAFVIMNLFPYNTGHVMIVPNDHVDSPEHANPDALAEMAALLPPLIRAARRVLGCHGFNIGINVGSIAGAGVAEHLHEHLVPRWNGDANFMPILGSAMVIPELIPVTYAKLRAELARELTPSATATAVIVDESRARIGKIGDSWLLSIPLDATRPVWRALVDTLPGTAIAGWAGRTRAGGRQSIALTLSAGGMLDGVEWVPREQALEIMEPSVRSIVQAALTNLAPTFVLTSP